MAGIQRVLNLLLAEGIYLFFTKEMDISLPKSHTNLFGPLQAGHICMPDCWFRFLVLFLSGNYSLLLCHWIIDGYDNYIF
jgi:hypothetical protein